MIGGTFGGLVGAPVTGVASEAAIPAINVSGLAVTGHGTGVIASAWGSLGDGYHFEDNSYNNKNGEWGSGSFDSPENCAEAHFKKHGQEVDAKDIEQYKRKAQEFARNVKKGVRGVDVSGDTPGVKKFRKNGKYIDLAPDGFILSFGK